MTAPFLRRARIRRSRSGIATIPDAAAGAAGGADTREWGRLT